MKGSFVRAKLINLLMKIYQNGELSMEDTKLKN